MKKHYSQLLLLCLFFTVKLFAQPLSGIYTINNLLPASAINFTSFSSFAAALNTNGVTGPVTANVLANAVFNEQVIFTQATGISSTNTITVNGNGATLTFNATLATSRHTLLLSGADYMTFNNLIVTGTNATNALSCHLWAGATDNTFNGCTFNAPLVGTGTFLCPFSVSGTSVSATATGLSGSANVVNTCTTNGGYYGIVFYSTTSAPFPVNSMVLNSVVRDFYSTGIYNVYNHSTTIKGNIVERPIRTAVTTSEGIQLGTNSVNCLVEGNHVRKLYEGISGSTSSGYGIYISADASLNNENLIINNIVSDFNSSGTQGGIYATSAAYANIFHNTINLDDVSSTAGTTYGVYLTGPNNRLQNNIITISRGGSGTKHCIYLTTAAAPTLFSNNNVLNMTSTAGSNNVGYLTVGYTTLAAWQLGTSFDLASSDADPMYTNPALMNFVPTSTVINNMCPFVGVLRDYTNFIRSTVSPDPGAYEFYTTSCTGAAPTNSVVAPNYVLCPNSTVNISLANTFTNTGYAIQWQSSSLSILGPYTAIPGATLASYNTNTLTSTIFYNALISCINGGGTVVAEAAQVQIALPTTNTVPYFEGFEGILFPDQLPNCSWATGPGGSSMTYTSIASNNRVPRSGSNFASFSNSPAGVSHFYSNGIFMSPGITYSASIWYINESIGYGNWTELALLVGQSQTVSPLQTIATTTNNAVTYAPLTNTFTVPSAGLYYMVIRATSNAQSSPYLSWDDLSVIIPCSLNSPSLALNNAPTTICSGNSVNLVASGADSYSWSSGQTQSLVTVAPASSTVYVVSGTNTLSGCTSSLSQAITVNPSPQIVLFSSSVTICEGQSTDLFAFGASSYNWSTGAFGPSITVTPLTSTTYSVIGLNTFSCSTLQTIQINVAQLPVVNTNSSPLLTCRGNNVDLIGSGAQSYQWTANSSVILYGNPVTVNAQSSGVYTMTGIDANGCRGTSIFVLSVEECTGINEKSFSDAGFNVYPNPSNGPLFLSSENAGPADYSIADISGRIVMSGKMSGGLKQISLLELPDGAYIVHLQAGETSKQVKIIKAGN